MTNAQIDYAERCKAFDSEMKTTMERAYTALNQCRNTKIPSLNTDSYAIAGEVGKLLVRVNK